MELKFAKLHPNALIPTRANAGDAGLDLTACSRYYQEDMDGDFYSYSTGLAVEIPEGFVGLIFPRSSISKKDLILANSVGVIDSGYRGEITARFKLTRHILESNVYQIGDKICQLMIVPCLFPNPIEIKKEQLSQTNRGTGNYGSSGN